MKLTTRYLGLELQNPIVPSASPLSRSVDTVKRLEDAGAAAIVMYSLFEEEIRMEEESADFFLEYGTESFAEALDYFPKIGDYTSGVDEYLEQLRALKEAVDIPVIASLNGSTPGGWINHAELLEEAGADALELNLYALPTDPLVPGGEVEDAYVETVRLVRETVRCPLAVKLSPFLSSIPHMADRLIRVGADGLVLFNRFYQPDLDPETLEVVPGLTLSSPWESRMVMRWIAILKGRVGGSLAATSGIHTAPDVLRMLMVGADVTQVCSALLQNGPGHVTQLLADLVAFGEEHGYESVEQMKGSMSQASCPYPAMFERANYMKVLQSWERIRDAGW